MKKLRLIALIALLPPPALAQQPATTPATRMLSGIVATASDVPLARVRVVVGVAGRFVTESRVLTDDRGQFTVPLPDADSVRVSFIKARYATHTIDLRRSDVNALNANGLRVRLSLGGAISGKVRDQYGAPAMQVVVSARRLDASSSAEAPELTATTNDLGEFRFGGLGAGTYGIVVRPSLTAAGTEIKGPDEQRVNLSLGTEAGGIDLAITVPSELAGRKPDRKPNDSSTGAVRGRVMTVRGVPIAGAIVQAYGRDNFMPAVESDERGRFLIDGLPPGDYRVLAFKRGFITPLPGQARSAVDYLLGDRSTQDRIIPLARGQTIESIDLVLGRGASISGT